MLANHHRIPALPYRPVQKMVLSTKGSPVPGRIQEAGTQNRLSRRGGSYGQYCSCTPQIACLPENLPYLPGLAGQTGSGVRIGPSVQPSSSRPWMIDCVKGTQSGAFWMSIGTGGGTWWTGRDVVLAAHPRKKPVVLFVFPTREHG